MKTRDLLVVLSLALLVAAGLVWHGVPSAREKEQSAALVAPDAATAPQGARATASPAAAARAGESSYGPGVRVVGLMVNAPTHTGADPATSDDFDVDLAFFGTFARTRVALEIERPEGGVYEVDADASELTVCRDDRGTDLRPRESVFGPYETGARVSEDGRHVVVVIGSERLPARGARELTIEGRVALLVAEELEVVTSDELRLQPGARASLDGIELEISRTGESEWTDAWEIDVEGTGDTTPVHRWALVGPDGAEIELRESTSLTGGGRWQRTLELTSEPPARARLRVERWSETEREIVPFAIDVPLGLGD